MVGKRFVLVSLAVASVGFATLAFGAVRRPSAPATRPATVRAPYDPFKLRRAAAATEARAPVQVRIQGAVVRPPYRPETRSPYQPPTRGPYLASTR
jgi:hypothetical protein